MKGIRASVGIPPSKPFPAQKKSKPCCCDFFARYRVKKTVFNRIDVLPKMVYSWTRPKTAMYPMTYASFQALDCGENGNMIDYTIQDLPEDRFEDAVAIIKDKHLIDEPMKSSKGVRDCPVSVQEMVDYLRDLLQQKISLVCYKEGSDEIVAVNILGVMTEAENNVAHKVK